MTPDIRTQLGRVADATDPTRDPIGIDELVDRRPSGRPSRLGPITLRVAAALLVTGMTVAVVVAATDDPDPAERVYSAVSPSASETANADLLAPGEAQALPHAPISGRSDAATVWTDTEVFVWGGNDERAGRNFADGATFDVRRGEWRLLPPAPLDPRGGASAVWTGTEVLVWGGFASKGIPEGEEPERADGAAYDPATRSWRRIPDAPVVGDGFARAVWTGEEMVVLTGRDPAAGAAYDPTEDTWRPIADPPLPLAQVHPQAVWTGERVVARLGSTSPPDESGVYAYDPVDDTWTGHGEPVGSTRADRIVWTGDRILLIPTDVDRRPASHDPATGRWEPVGDAPPAAVATTRRAPLALWTGRRAVVWGSGFVAAFDPGPGTWAVAGAAGPPTDADAGVSAVWADGVLFVWGGFPDVAEGTLSRPPGGEPEVSCPAVAPTPAPARGEERSVAPDANRFGATMADGRTYEVVADDAGYTLSIDGKPGTRTGGSGTTVGNSWTNTSWEGPGPDRQLGLAVGVRPPGAVRTAVLDDKGEAHCTGLTFSPDGRWFAIPDVHPDWLVVHQDADGADVVDPLTGSGPCTVAGDCPAG